MSDDGEVVAATEKALKAATHLTDQDAGAVATLRTLARKIDSEDALRELALEHAAENKQKPPHVDNVSIPTYLKYCDSLGLTPAGRARMKVKAEKPAGKLGQLRSVANPA